MSYTSLKKRDTLLYIYFPIPHSPSVCILSFLFLVSTLITNMPETKLFL